MIHLVFLIKNADYGSNKVLIYPGGIKVTECERLIQEGFITEKYLQPEILCDFYVDSARKHGL